MARDPNGATDLAAIEAQIRKITEISPDGTATGNWQNWRGLGLLGTKFGSSHWFDLNDNTADGLELLITAGSTIQERIDRNFGSGVPISMAMGCSKPAGFTGSRCNPQSTGLLLPVRTNC